MKKRICLSAFLLVLPLTTAVAQQQPPPLDSGARVRVTAPDLGISKQQATFEALRGDTIRLQTDGAVTAVPLTSVVKLEVWQGRKSRWLTGGIVGFAMGGVALGITAGVACSKTSSDCYSSPDHEPVLVGAAVGGIIGGLLGAGIGAFIKTDKWEEVPLDRFRVSLVPRRDGVALGFSVAF